MFLASILPQLPRIAETVTCLGLTLFLQTGLLIGLCLLGSRWVRRKGAAPLSTWFRLTLAAVVVCPLAAIAWHFSGIRLQPFRLPSSTAQAAPAPSPVVDGLLPSLDLRHRDAVATPPTGRGAVRPRLVAPANDFGDLSLPAGRRTTRETGLRDPGAVVAGSQEAQSVSPTVGSPVETEQAPPEPASQNASSGVWSWFCVVFAAGWLTISLALLVRLAYAHSRMIRVYREANPAPDPVQAACARLAEDFGVKAPQVLISPYAPVPCLLGIRRPVILYPAGERATVIEVLYHELAHLARKDCLWFLIGHIVQAILFFQPLLRVLIRRFEQASDDVCDDLVLEYSSNRRRYARELVRIAQIQQVGHDQLLAALGAVSFRSRLGKRIERIVNLSRTLSPRTGRRDRLALTAAALSCTLVVALVQVGAAPAAATDGNRPAIAKPSAVDRTAPPEDSSRASVALGTGLSGENTISTSKDARRPTSRDPAVGEAMRTRVNSWLASAASAVRQNAMTQTDKPVEHATPEQPSSESALAPPSSQPTEDARSTTAAVESVDTQSNDERATSLNNVKRTELQGTVYDNDGQPAADAEVWAYPFINNFWQMIESTTDVDGQFKLDLTPGEWRVMARKDTRSGVANNQYGWVLIVPSSPPEPCIIRLTPGGTLRGQLLDGQTGEVIARGCIWIDHCGLVRADERGRYEVRGLSLGPHHFVVLCRGYRRSYLLLDTSLQPEAELDIRCTRGGRVLGKVVDERGRPIPGAICGHETSGLSTAIVALFEGCDAKGEFVWDGVAYDRPLHLDAEAPGYESEYQEITVTEGSDAARVVFQLKRKNLQNRPKPTRTISGVVRTPDGKAVRGARVRVYYYYEQSRRSEATTDAGGRFALRRVLDGGGVGYLMVTAKGHSPAFASILQQGSLDVDLVLDSGRTVRGTVQDSNGRPLEGVMVLPVATASLEPGCIEPWVWQLHTLTDKNGRFELTNLPQNGFRYDFFVDGNPKRISRMDLQDNVVITKPGRGAYRGRVIDPQGNPVRDFRIMLNLSHCEPTRPALPSSSVNGVDPNVHTTGFYIGLKCGGVLYTSPDGTFVLGDVLSSNIDAVIADVPGYGRAVAECAHARVLEKLGPPEELTLQLRPPHQLRVRVVEDRDPMTPVVGASVGLVPYEFSNASYRHPPDPSACFEWGVDDDHQMLARTDANGWASFTGLGPDEGTVIVQADGFARERLEWLGDKPDKPDIIARLKPECVLEGVINDASGNRPLREFRVRLDRGAWKELSPGPWAPGIAPGTKVWSREETFYVWSGPEGKGRFRLAGLIPGNYILWILTPDFARQRQFYREEFTLSEGKTHEVAAVAASEPVPVDLWGEPIISPPRNGRLPAGGGAIGRMGVSPNRGRSSGR